MLYSWFQMAWIPPLTPCAHSRVAVVQRKLGSKHPVHMGVGWAWCWDPKPASQTTLSLSAGWVLLWLPVLSPVTEATSKTAQELPAPQDYWAGFSCTHTWCWNAPAQMEKPRSNWEVQRSLRENHLLQGRGRQECMPTSPEITQQFSSPVPWG